MYQVIICRYTLLRICDFTASTSADLCGLAWVPNTLEKECLLSDHSFDVELGCHNFPAGV